MNRKFLTAAGTAVLAASLAACGGHHHASTDAHALATSTAVATAKAEARAYMGACIPAKTDPGTAQLAFYRSLLKKAGRDTLAACLAISPAERKPFEAAVLTGAEGVKWSSKASRDQFLFVTIEGDAAKYHGTTAPTPAPSATK